MQPSAVVLGNYLNDDGSCSVALLERLNAALTLFLQGGVEKLILSGGATNKLAGRAEADVMAEWLIARGVPEESLLRETRSLTTATNAKYCAELLRGKELGRLYLISSAKHVYRAYLNPKRLFLLRGIPVKNLPCFDSNIKLLRGGEGCELIIYGSKRALDRYLADHPDGRVFIKKKYGLVREKFLPESIGRGNNSATQRLLRQMQAIYGTVKLTVL